MPDYTNLNQKFRNHYEKTKLQGEQLVKKYEKETKVRCRIFRPSTIAGKLIENVKGEIYKFDVFYGWAYFFLKYKAKEYKNNLNSIYDENMIMNARIAINNAAGLNIVPVDFAAKVLYQVCKQDIAGDYFHLVSDQETSHKLYLGKILEILNITGFSFVEGIPTDLNAFERFYYKTVDSVFTPYIHQKEINFNTDNLQELYAQQNLYCPVINEENLKILLGFAKTKNFGLVMK